MTTTGLTPRLAARIELDFPGQLDEVVATLHAASSGNQDRERILAAAILAADGDMLRLQQAVTLSQLDWRDLLVGAGPANTDWPQCLNAEFGGSGAHS